MIELRQTAVLSIKSIWRNKTRSGLTMLGIIIGVGAVILLVSLGRGLQKYITGQFEELGTNLVIVLPGKLGTGEGLSHGPPNFAGSKLTLKHVSDIQRLGEPIEAVAAGIEFPTAVKYKGKSKYSTAAGVTANYGRVRNIKVGKGRGLVETDIKLSRKVALLGKGIADTLFGQSEAIGQNITIGESKFQIIGILEGIGSGGFGFDVDNFVIIPITAAQKMTNNNNIQAITVKARTKEEIPQVINLTNKLLLQKLQDDEFSVIDQSGLLTTINQILTVLTAALGGIAAISLLVGGVGIMNIMLVSVTERTREIGLRKAVGAKSSDILTQFLIEAVTLSILGGAIGVLLGWGGSVILNNFFPTSVTLWSVVLAFEVSAAVGIIFGVAPAINASRLDPIEALRYE